MVTMGDVLFLWLLSYQMACPLSGRNPLVLCNNLSLSDASSTLSVLYKLSQALPLKLFDAYQMLKPDASDDHAAGRGFPFFFIYIDS